jgi:two-component system LytT family sensor kinase
VSRDTRPGSDWPSRPLASGRVWLGSLAFWTSLAAFTATVRYAYYFERQHIAWRHSLAYSLVAALLWAVLTPVLMAFGTQFRLDRETFPRLPLHLAVSIVLPVFYWFPLTGLTQVLGQGFGDAGWKWELTRHDFTAGYLLNLMVSIQVLAVGQGLLFHHESCARALRASRLEADLARAELHLLRTQLEPHFLFNTLNAVATLVHGNPDAAERMIVLLSDLLRRALRDRDEHEVPLAEELAFLDRYMRPTSL